MQSRLATVASTCFYLHASPTAIRTLRISDAARSVEARLPSLPTGIYMVIFICVPGRRGGDTLVSCVLSFVGAVALNVCCYVWSYCNMFVHDISNYGDSLAHGEGS